MVGMPQSQRKTAGMISDQKKGIWWFTGGMTEFK
jgi:hypothetical protein